MPDLFTPGANPDLPLPAYGSLSASDESALYAADKPRWQQYVAQGYAMRFRARGLPRAMVVTQWCSVLSKELREAIWALLNVGERAEMTAAVDDYRQKQKELEQTANR
ncbi:MAG TPA: hypothetical protein VLE97_01715 [Gaiellaceae bacterium]|nr:hypothetical protein [Gaiellaceae bacterium]